MNQEILNNLFALTFSGAGEVVEGKGIRYQDDSQFESWVSFPTREPTKSVITTYHKTGSILGQFYMENGQLHGTLTFYYPNGTKSSVCNYQNGLLHGEEIFYDMNGEIEYEATWENHEIIAEKEY